MSQQYPPSEHAITLPLKQANRAISHVAARSSSPEKMSNDRVFQALEEAIPWSQSRKLRHEQRAKIKVPAPDANSRLSGRAGRMVKPYARSRDAEYMSIGDVDMNEGERPSKTNRLLESLMEKRRTTMKGPADEAEAQDVENSTQKANESENGANQPDPKFDDKTVAANSLTKLLPPLSSISEATEPAEPLPFALVPTTHAPSDVSSTPILGFQSSLRERRTRTSAIHASSAPRRPTSHEKRPNRFAIDDEEDATAITDVEAGDADLKKWASKSGIALEVPVGWSFGGATGTASTSSIQPMGVDLVKTETSHTVRAI